MMKTRIMILALIYLLMLGSVFSTEKKDSINDYWQSLFTEPFETAYIFLKDYTFFPWTSREEVIYIEVGKLEEMLEKNGYKIEDIAVIIHNHLMDCTFSPQDHKQYRRLKKHGFKGMFLLYSNLTKKTYNIENEVK